MSDNNSDLTMETKKTVILQMMAEWQRMSYSQEVNVRIAGRLDDDAMKQRAVELMARAEKALDVLRELEQANA